MNYQHFLFRLKPGHPGFYFRRGDTDARPLLGEEIQSNSVA